MAEYPQIGVRADPALIQLVDEWRRKQEDVPTRPEAIRRLVELGLTVKTPARRTSKPGRGLRARELATKSIDNMIDQAAPLEERAQRRRRLTKGPLEFRDYRVDLPKATGK